MVSLPEDIGDLKSLTKLNLRDCCKLESLPDCIVELEALNILNLRECTKLVSLSEGFGGLNLTDVNFGYCKTLDLGLIFDVIFKFEGLTKLDLAGLKMESLPERIRDLTSLQTLNLYECKDLISLPERIGELESLTELNLARCESLISLPWSPPLETNGSES